jgi:photosystem II stability/assembly factor-like uncharacterized protein
MPTARHFVLAAAIAMLLAGASYARGAPPASPPSISAIQVDPMSPNVVYASTLDQGVLKSTDGGRTWSVANTGLPVPPRSPIRVDVLALDPRSPNVLYAGTGLGVFKTRDGARTWKLASTGIDFGRDPLGHRLVEGFVWAIAIDPVRTSTVYAAGNGVWKSTNGGASWKHVLRNGALNLAVDPRRPEIVCASGGFQSQASRNSIYKTVNGGRSWRATGPAGLIDNYFGHPIVVDPRPPGIIYAGGSRGLFASTNQGRTWSQRLPLRSASSGVNAIALDPSRANVLYLGTTQGFMKSSDGGQNWLAQYLDGASFSSIAIARTRPETIYAGVQRKAAPQPSAGGMLASTDGGATWHHLF